MSAALEVTPTDHDVKSGVRNTESIAEGLSDLLADTYRLTFKTHAYHWNVEGPLFFSLHKLTEEQYENLFDAADELAERVRALGKLAPARLDAIVSASIIKDKDKTPSAGEMCTDLAEDLGPGAGSAPGVHRPGQPVERPLRSDGQKNHMTEPR